MPVERWEAACDERLGEALRRLGQVVDDAETAEALAEDAPLLDPKLVADRLRVANDRVGPEVGQIVGLLLSRQVRKRADRSRSAGAALVEQEQPVVLERVLPPGVFDQLEQAGRFTAGTALEEDEPGQLVALMPGSDDLAGEHRDLPAVESGVVERELELVLGEDEVRRAVSRDSHAAILLCPQLARSGSRRCGARASGAASR